jgi:hypothetical protein
VSKRAVAEADAESPGGGDFAGGWVSKRAVAEADAESPGGGDFVESLTDALGSGELWCLPS